LPDFSLNNIPKREKYTQMTTKYTKRPLNISNGRKIDQMVIKYTNNFHCKTLQNLPKLGFGFENKPTGNPARETRLGELSPIGLLIEHSQSSANYWAIFSTLQAMYLFWLENGLATCWTIIAKKHIWSPWF
jgi:hypothetical protein